MLYRDLYSQRNSQLVEEFISRAGTAKARYRLCAEMFKLSESRVKQIILRLLKA